MAPELLFISNIWWRVWKRAMVFVLRIGGGNGLSSQMIGKAAGIYIRPVESIGDALNTSKWLYGKYLLDPDTYWSISTWSWFSAFEVGVFFILIFWEKNVIFFGVTITVKHTFRSIIDLSFFVSFGFVVSITIYSYSSFFVVVIDYKIFQLQVTPFYAYDSSICLFGIVFVLLLFFRNTETIFCDLLFVKIVLAFLKKLLVYPVNVFYRRATFWGEQKKHSCPCELFEF